MTRIFGGKDLWNPLTLLTNQAKKKKQAMTVPTLDQARANKQEADRINRRRGVLGNIFGGTGSTAPTVASKTLLGQ